MIHMCYILSEPLPGFVACSRGVEGAVCVCVCVSILCMCEDSWRALLPCNDLPDPECFQCSLEVMSFTFHLYNDSYEKNLSCC